MTKHKVVIIGFFDEYGKVLLNRRADASAEMWELIGGGIEEDETPLEAIRREVNEEIGYPLDLKSDRLKLEQEFELNEDGFSAEVHYFSAIFPSMDKFTDSDETFVSDLRLFTISEAFQLPLLPITKKIMGDLAG